MTANYVLLEKITVGAAGASSVEFTGIPQTGYTDLVVKTSVRDTFNANALDHWIRFNSVTTNYTWRKVQGSGSVASSSTATVDPYLVLGVGPGAAATANTFGNFEVYIPNYTSSNFKSISVDSVGENNGTQAFQVLNAGLWSNTAAITSIQLIPQSGGGWAPNSTFYLYGVAKLGTTPAIVPYATGGDTIMTDGTYWYHAFTSSGTFTPTKALSCDILQVAGGGAGGWAGAGGGAGGVLGFSAQAITSASTVTIGAGGATVTGAGPQNNGSNSQFASLTASVGGGGGGVNNGGSFFNGANGGSGGGGSIGSGGIGNGTGGTATSGQGFNGGTGYGTPPNSGQPSTAGGGGSGAVGNNGANSASGAGGAGKNNIVTWQSSALTALGLGVSGFLAGGGGGGGFAAASGGAGGSGGGGAGSANAAGAAGTANTGSGGGGGNYQTGGNGGAGGSGLVIVRYAV